MTLITTVYETGLNIILAFAYFIISLIIGKFLGKLVTSILIEAGLQQILEKVGIEFRLSDVAGKLWSYIIYIAGVWLALEKLGLTKIIAIILIIFGLFLTIVALTFGIQDFIKNVFIGMLIRKKYAKKTRVNVKGIKGVVIKNTLTTVRVYSRGDILVIPYTAFLEKKH